MANQYLNLIIMALALSTSELELISRVVYSEARGEPLEGQLLVAQCVLDRVDHLGDSVEKVIFAPKQFAKPGQLDKEIFERIKRRRLYPNYKILYFRRTQSKRNWFAPYLFHIGNHAFYGYYTGRNVT